MNPSRGRTSATISAPATPSRSSRSHKTPRNTRNRATAPGEAPAIAYETRIFDRFRDEIRWRGLVGEVATAATPYLIFTSRLLDKPVGGGQRPLVLRQVVHRADHHQVLPPRRGHRVHCDERAGARLQCRDFRHRTLVVYEIVALREYVEDNMTAYFVPLAALGGTDRLRGHGPPGRYGFHREADQQRRPDESVLHDDPQARVQLNETRVLSLTTDDSPLRRVGCCSSSPSRPAQAAISEPWLALQRWLASASDGSRSRTPRLAEVVPPVTVRLRHDFGAVLSLIHAHAILHQATRDHDPDGRIVATVDDYDAVVLDLVGDSSPRGSGRRSRRPAGDRGHGRRPRSRAPRRGHRTCRRRPARARQVQRVASTPRRCG